MNTQTRTDTCGKIKRQTWLWLLIVKLSPLHDEPKSMSHYILFHLHDNNKSRWLEQTKVIFDVQHQTTYTWRVWHHDDSKLITRQQTSGCFEDKGLAFCLLLLLFEPENTEQKKREKDLTWKDQHCWESTEMGRYLPSKRLSHFKSRDFFPNGHWRSLCIAAVCLCR